MRDANTTLVDCSLTDSKAKVVLLSSPVNIYAYNVFCVVQYGGSFYSHEGYIYMSNSTISNSTATVSTSLSFLGFVTTAHSFYTMFSIS